MTDKFFPCDAEHFSKVYRGKVSEEQEEKTAKALKEYRQRKELPEELRKVEKTGLEVRLLNNPLTPDGHFANKQKWLPSLVVASFLEAIKKELKEALCQRKSIGYPCGKVSELCNHCKVFDTVFGGEGK